MGQQVGEVTLRIDVVELAGFDERGHGGPSRAAVVAGGEQRVLAAEADRADGALDGVVVEFDPAIVEEPNEARVPPAVTETSVCRLSGEPCRLKLLLAEVCWGHEAMAFDQPGGVVERAEFQQGLA